MKNLTRIQFCYIPKTQNALKLTEICYIQSYFSIRNALKLSFGDVILKIFPEDKPPYGREGKKGNKGEEILRGR
jgi:hypothetical protein